MAKRSLYQQFHGRPPTRIRIAYYKSPKSKEKVIKIGRLAELVYNPEPPSQYAGKYYKHQFGDYGYKFGKQQPILAVSRDGKQLYIINDRAKPKFGKRGIVG